MKTLRVEVTQEDMDAAANALSLSPVGLAIDRLLDDAVWATIVELTAVRIILLTEEGGKGEEIGVKLPSRVTSWLMNYRRMPEDSRKRMVPPPPFVLNVPDALPLGKVSSV